MAAATAAGALLLLLVLLHCPLGRAFLRPPQPPPPQAQRPLVAPHGAHCHLQHPRSQGVALQAIQAGECVVVKETGRRARVVSKQSNGWWRLEEEGEDGRIISARTGSLLELDGGSDTTAAAAGADAGGKAVGGSGQQQQQRRRHPQVSGPDGTLLPLRLDPGRHPLHAATQDWVVFSDLHCSVQTLATCREVLARVHAEAVARDAGVIFLGDFWHIRGALRVEVLNSIMRDLGGWTQPVVMLPGNHDQVTLDGTVHALTPLGFAVGSSVGPAAAAAASAPASGSSAATPQAVVLTQPTVFLDALWLPYSRDPGLTRALLAPYHQAPTSDEEEDDEDHDDEDDDVRGVFCHVDVRGAAMNDNTLSRRGLQPTAFPARLPTYSGHFHKPHRVPRCPVTYIGSPYQVSLAEAGQAKRLLVLRRPQLGVGGGVGGGGGGYWEEVASVAIDVGRRYFRPPSLGAARELLGAGTLRRGDRVVLNLPESTVPEAEALREELRAGAGAELEVREVPPDDVGGPLLQSLLELELDGVGGGATGAEAGGRGRLAGMMDVETLGTGAVWRAYMNESGAPAEVVEEGLRFIDAWEASSGAAGAGRTSNASTSTLPTNPAGDGGTVRLELERVRLEGYGPFREPVEYPLGGRGLVLLRGKNLDDPGAESNAAGKSKLAMAGLWALTGEGDERPVMDARVTDVAFDVTSRGRAAFAEVTLAGAVNGVPFEVTRRRGARTNQLQFVLAGQDLSRQSARETQRAMEEALGLDLDFLGLAIFCGQHQMNGLLEATDVRLKERLSKVVRLEVWEGLKELAKARLKQGQEEVAEADTRVRVQELDLERQAREEAELREALERESEAGGAGAGAGAGDAATAAAAGTTGPRTLELVEAELARAGQQLEAARAAWKAALERREQAARGRAEAGESAGARRERLRTLRQGFEEDARAMALLEDRWDPARYWGDLQLFGLVAKDAQPQLAELGLAFAAHVPNEAFAARLQAVEAARGQGLADVGAAMSELRKVEAALASLSAGKPGGEGGEPSATEQAQEGDSSSGGSVLEGGCPTCGRPWEEGADAENAAAHLEAEALKLRTRLQEGQQRQLRLDKQRAAVAGIADAHVQYLRDVQDWRMLQQRLEARGVELAEVDKQVAAEAPLLAREAAASKAEEEELGARERALRESQLAYDKLQDERPRLVQQQAEREARAKAAAEARQRWEKKQLEVGKLREELERLKAVRAERDARSKLARELVDRFGMRGVQAFVLRSAVAQLERLANRFLALLSEGGLRLGLALDGEKITKAVRVRGADGVFHDRSLAQLSGGQWRRASLAALLAFRELSRLRARVDCNVIVLDEVLNHLDGPGRARVGRVLRAMCQRPARPADATAADANAAGASGPGRGKDYGGISTAIVILQDLASGELEDSFDFVDEVVKEGDVSRVVVDERADVDADEAFFDGGEDSAEGAASGGKGGGELLDQTAVEEEPAVKEKRDSQKEAAPQVVVEDVKKQQGKEGGEEEGKEEEEKAKGKEPARPVQQSGKKLRLADVAAAAEPAKERQLAVVQGGWLDGLEEAIL